MYGSPATHQPRACPHRVRHLRSVQRAGRLQAGPELVEAHAPLEAALRMLNADALCGAFPGLRRMPTEAVSLLNLSLNPVRHGPYLGCPHEQRKQRVCEASR
jgi:hypothetical protein